MEKWIDLQYCALCRKVARRELFAKIPSLRLVLVMILVRSILELHAGQSYGELFRLFCTSLSDLISFFRSPATIFVKVFLAVFVIAFRVC